VSGVLARAVGAALDFAGADGAAEAVREEGVIGALSPDRRDRDDGGPVDPRPPPPPKAPPEVDPLDVLLGRLRVVAEASPEVLPLLVRVASLPA
jgi:hypothetical protein